MPSRRFPPPWSVEDLGAAFVVKDGSGQKLAYVYFASFCKWKNKPMFLSHPRHRELI